MHLHAIYDKEASIMAEKLTFYCEKYELTRQDIMELKNKKLLKFVKWDDLPETISCQVLIHCEGINKAKVIFFNPSFELPKECFDQEFLNKDLLEWHQRYWGLRVEFMIPLGDKGIQLTFSYES